MANYIRTHSDPKSSSSLSLNERKKRDLIRKAMESSISCKFQVFLAIFDQNHRLSIFTNEGKPEQFIESYLMNLSFLRESLSLKDYSSLCQEESEWAEEKEFNINTLNHRFDSHSDGKRSSVNIRTNEHKYHNNNCRSERYSFLKDIPNSKSSGTGEQIKTLEFKIPKMNNSSNETDESNKGTTGLGSSLKKRVYKPKDKDGVGNGGECDYRSYDLLQKQQMELQQQHQMQIELQRKRQLKEQLRLELELPYERNKTSLYGKNDSLYYYNNNNNDQSFLNLKRKRCEKNPSLQLSPSNEIVFQNDQFRMFKTNKTFSFLEEDIILSGNHSTIENKTMILKHATQQQGQSQPQQKYQQEIPSATSEPKQSYNNKGNTSPFNDPRPSTSNTTYKNNIIILEEEGGKTTVVTKNDTKADDDFHKISKKKTKNYIFFHSDKLDIK